MPEVVIKGETHTSTKDNEELQELGESEFDAGFLEGVKDKFPKKKYSFTAIFFLLGRLEHRYFEDRLFPSRDDLIEELDNTHFIDAELMELFNYSPVWKSWIIFLVSVVFGLLLLANLIILTKGLPTELFSGVVVLGAFLFVLILAPIHFVMHAFESLPDRDNLMSERIVEITESEGYEKVLINCGNLHSPGIYRNLDSLEDWDVEVESSKSRFIFHKLFAGTIKLFFSPIKSYLKSPEKEFSPRPK